MGFYSKVLCLCLLVMGTFSAAQAQINLRKLKQKAERAVDRAVDRTIDRAIDKKVDEAFGIEGENSSTTSNGRSTNSIDGRGQKLTPPDVSQHLSDADAAIASNDYSTAKFNIQQAILGVELEIGYAILDDLPKTVQGMSFDESNDQVSSSGAGYLGFTLGRNYESNNKVLNFGIVSNSLLVASYSSILTNSTYTDGEGNQKRVNIDGNTGALTYDDGNYELALPIGSSSVMLFDCNGFANENEVIAAVKLFDINGIQQLLGEQ
ncbi:MAG: hypothetical protein AAGI23_15520 [Bacteroidota bacterium]